MMKPQKVAQTFLTARQKVFIPFLFVNSVLIPLFLPAGRQRSQDFLPGRHSCL